MKNSYKYLISAILLIAVVCLTVPQTVSAEDHPKSSSEEVVAPELSIQMEQIDPEPVMCPEGYYGVMVFCYPYPVACVPGDWTLDELGVYISFLEGYMCW